MITLIEMEKDLNKKIIAGCWKAIGGIIIITILIFFSPLANFSTEQFYVFLTCLILGFGMFSFLFLSSLSRWTKYYVNFTLILTILVSAITLKNPEVFAMFYFIIFINMSYKDRALHFISSAFSLSCYILATLFYSPLLPSPSVEDSSLSLLITRVTIFLTVMFLVDILNSYAKFLTDKLIQKEKELSIAVLTDTVGALIGALEAKDEYTNGHSTRTSQYALQLAKKLMIEIDEESFLTGAILHDIGKIGIPDSVLDKKGRLTSEEYTLIKEHPLKGAKILKNTNSLKHVVPMVIHHHERFDGTGYPAGLAGEAIPLEARILAVADTFDALTSNRPYRLAFSPEYAYEEIIKHSGDQFCPTCIEAFKEVYSELCEIYKYSNKTYQLTLNIN
jgi:putative nucleotidyltransferase with HDIG domain